MQISTDATLCPHPSAYIRPLEDPLQFPIRQIAGDIERVTGREHGRLRMQAGLAENVVGRDDMMRWSPIFACVLSPTRVPDLLYALDVLSRSTFCVAKLLYPLVTLLF
jgi:hypothetical protein